ncbi:DUF2561 family protein [Mycobacterium sp. E3247]|uniref:DUF2561 family protein n=1 Tax=Mycobacterium sp. E3247 TaxID=1856864 RepID=UPI001E4E3E93|nr:DUF2561 family protein [Mycobacterium sp. E3247]
MVSRYSAYRRGLGDDTVSPDVVDRILIGACAVVWLVLLGVSVAAAVALSDLGRGFHKAAGGGGGLVVVISSCIGGVDGTVVVVFGLASLVVSVRANNSDTETTSAMAATMAAIPTTHGQRGAACSSSVSSDSSKAS